MLTVEKIGGTSMSALQKVIDNIILFEREGMHRYNHIYVVSAFSGVTDMLLENKKTGKGGVYHRIEKHYDFHNTLGNVLEELKAINATQANIGLDVKIANCFIDMRVHRCIDTSIIW